VAGWPSFRSAAEVNRRGRNLQERRASTALRRDGVEKDASKITADLKTASDELESALSEVVASRKHSTISENIRKISGKTCSESFRRQRKRKIAKRDSQTRNGNPVGSRSYRRRYRDCLRCPRC